MSASRPVVRYQSIREPDSVLKQTITDYGCARSLRLYVNSRLADLFRNEFIWRVTRIDLLYYL